MGEYCVAVAGVAGAPEMTLYMEYPYGKLPPTQYPLMPVREEKREDKRKNIIYDVWYMVYEYDV